MYAMLNVELLNVGLAAVLFFACLALSLWKAIFDDLHPLFWRLTATMLWAGIAMLVLSSSGLEHLAFVYVVGWMLIAGGLAATLIRTALTWYYPVSPHVAVDGRSAPRQTSRNGRPGMQA